MRRLPPAEGRAGARSMTHLSAAELNPALAPRGLDTFVLGSEHLWYAFVLGLEHLRYAFVLGSEHLRYVFVLGPEHLWYLRRGH